MGYVFFLCVCRGASVAHKTHPLCDRRRCRGGRCKPWKASSFYVIHLYDLLKANEILEGTTRGFNNSPFLYETLCRGSGSGGHCYTFSSFFWALHWTKRPSPLGLHNGMYLKGTAM